MSSYASQLASFHVLSKFRKGALSGRKQSRPRRLLLEQLDDRRLLAWSLSGTGDLPSEGSADVDGSIDAAAEYDSASDAVLALSNPVIDVGDRVLLAGTLNPAFPIYVSGGHSVLGGDFYFQVEDGGPPAGGVTLGPAIVGVTVIGNAEQPTIFTDSNQGELGNGGIVPQFWHGGTVTMPNEFATADGVLAWVTIDAAGFLADHAGNPFDFSLKDTLMGDTSFGEEVPIDITNGRLVLKELPTALISTPTAVDEGGMIQLDGSASSAWDPNDTIAMYEWDLDGDGVFGETGEDAGRGEEVGAFPMFSPVGLDGPGTYQVKLRVKDSNYAQNSLFVSDEATATFAINNAAPTLALFGDATVNEGLTYTLTLGDITDPGTDTVTQWIVHWGDGTSDTYTSDGDVTHVYADDDPTATPSDGTTITVDLVDEDGTHVAAGTKAIMVFNVAPVVSAGADATILEGGTFSQPGSFTDPGTDAWTATVDYGDGSGVQALPLTGKAFALSHVYADNGSYTVTVTITDDDTGTHADTVTVTVDNVPPTIALTGDATVNEGSTYTLTLGGITDPGTDTVTEWIVHWGDGTSDTYTSGGDVTHVYADDDPTATPSDGTTITVDLVDEDGTHLAAGTKAITVFNVAPVVSAGADATILEGGTFSQTGSFTDPGTDAWTATVDYGDGSGVQALTLTGKIFALSHVYADNGSYTVTVTITDDDTGTHADTVTVTVDNVPPTIALTGDATVNEGSTYTLTLGGITDPGDDTVTEWTVHWGDGTSDTYTSGGDVTHVYADDDPPGTAFDPYTITVDLVDEDGTHGSAGIKLITVQNVAPQVWVGDDAAIEAGDTFTSAGGVVDPGADSWTAVVDYGDGSGVQPLILNADKTFSLSHVYADEGVYFVTVTVGDDDLGAGEETLMVQVAARTYPWQNRRHAYDVTDDGWITAEDVLADINEINNRGARELPVPPLSSQLPPPYVDVSGDNWLTAQDVLLVINYINKYGSGPIPDAPSAAASLPPDGSAAGGEGEGWPVEQRAKSARAVGELAGAEAEILGRTGAFAARGTKVAAVDERFAQIGSGHHERDGRWTAERLAGAAGELARGSRGAYPRRLSREAFEDVLTLLAEQSAEPQLDEVLKSHDALFALRSHD